MSAGTISLILNFFFVFILIIGFLIGLWRGVKRSAINFVFGIIGMLISFFCAPILTRTILNINVNANGNMTTLNAVLIEMLKGIPEFGTLIENTPSLGAFIVNLPYAIMTTVIFLLLSMVISFIMYILFKIFCAIFVKNKDKDGNVLPRHRVWGGVLGTVKTFALTIFVCLPFVGLLGTAEEVTSKNGMLENVMNTQAADAIVGVDDSAFGVIGNMFGLDNATFDYLSMFDMNGQPIYIREEVSNYNVIYYSAKQLSLAFSDGTLVNFSFDKLENSVEKVLESGLYNTVISDVLDNVLVNYQDYEFINPEDFGEFKDVFLDVSKALASYEGGAGNYIADDLRKLLDGVRVLAESGAIDEISQTQANFADLAQTYEKEFTNAIYNTLTTNIVKDSASSTINLLIGKLFNDLEKVDINGREISDTEWKETATSLVQIAKDASVVIKEVEIDQVLNDPMTLLKQESKADISSVLASLGKLIDNVRSIKILQNNNVSVIDKLLEGKLDLPSIEQDFFDINDPDKPIKKITNYVELMAFISPSMQKLKDINVYELLNEEVISTSKVFKKFGEAAAKDDLLLSRIFLPLIQVEPTKSIFIGTQTQEGLLTSLESEVINFKLLENYHEWEIDLANISKLFSVLNKNYDSERTFLDIVMESGADELLKCLGNEQAQAQPSVSVDDVFKPILYAKSTEAIKNSSFESLANVLTSLTGSTITFDLQGVTLVKHNTNDQANEICEVFEKFLAFYPNYTSGMQLQDIDKLQLGQLLDAMKVNALRTTLTQKTEEGLFKEAFNALVDKVKNTFHVNIAPDYASQDNYFAQLLSSLSLPEA